MQMQDARRIREAVDDMLAAVDRAAPHMTHEQLARVGEQLEVFGRALTSIATARLVERAAPSDHAHDLRSHHIDKDDL